PRWGAIISLKVINFVLRNTASLLRGPRCDVSLSIRKDQRRREKVSELFVTKSVNQQRTERVGVSKAQSERDPLSHTCATGLFLNSGLLRLSNEISETSTSDPTRQVKRRPITFG